jgi:hypothetical protein
LDRFSRFRAKFHRKSAKNAKFSEKMPQNILNMPIFADFSQEMASVPFPSTLFADES